MPLVSNWAKANGPKATMQSAAAIRYGIRRGVICSPKGIAWDLRGGSNPVNLPLLRLGIHTNWCRRPEKKAPRYARGAVSENYPRGKAFRRLRGAAGWYRGAGGTSAHCRRFSFAAGC